MRQLWRKTTSYKWETLTLEEDSWAKNISLHSHLNPHFGIDRLYSIFSTVIVLLTWRILKWGCWHTTKRWFVIGLHITSTRSRFTNAVSRSFATANNEGSRLAEANSILKNHGYTFVCKFLEILGGLTIDRIVGY